MRRIEIEARLRTFMMEALMIYPLAAWRPGPASKAGYAGVAGNSAEGVVCHSMAGYRDAAMRVLDDPQRRASWHFSVLQNGSVLQHYDSLAVAWHCGSREWNARLIGIEHEGGLEPEDEPLTNAQHDASVALVRWLAEQHGFPLIRRVGLWEHREVAPPSDPTACPSGRIPWQHYIEEEARVYSDAEIDAKVGELFRQLAALGKKLDDLSQALTTAVVDHNRRLVAIETKASGQIDRAGS
ncbi:MAG: N-acetylmuramoyl-L-alanine amidase [Chloroflexota bacterium]|nr:N-acetylmuramoyl-L-alanine amidase [Chloroflexota bacterium]